MRHKIGSGSIDKPMYYILEGKEPKPIDDLMKWVKWLETAKKHVAETHLEPNVCVSTVFLGVDHSFVGPYPILFETMIFGGPHDGYRDRYCTWEEAEKGHEKAVKLAQEGNKL